MPLYDEEGKEIEGALAPEEAIAIQEKIKELEEKATKADTLEAELNEAKEKLKSLETKDFDFSRLKNKTKEEKDEMLKKFTQKEQALFLKVNELEEQIETNKSQVMASYEEDVLTSLAGNNEDLRTKIKETAKEFVGDVKTKEDLLARYKKAFTFLRGSSPEINQLNRYVPSSTSQIPPDRQERFTDTPEGKDAYKRAFNTDLDKKK